MEGVVSGAFEEQLGGQEALPAQMEVDRPQCHVLHLGWRQVEHPMKQWWSRQRRPVNRSRRVHAASGMDLAAKLLDVACDRDLNVAKGAAGVRRRARKGLGDWGAWEGVGGVWGGKGTRVGGMGG